MFDNFLQLDWLDLKWFQIETLQSFYWHQAWVFYMMPFVLLLPFFRWLFHVPFRQRLEMGQALEQRKWNDYLVFFRFLPKLIFQFFILCILLALAQPQVLVKNKTNLNEGLDIFLVIDVSESMMLQDFKPNRFEASKKVMLDFVKSLKNDNVGLVIFTSQAFTLLPATNDYELLTEKIKSLSTKSLDKGASAIGNALGIAIQNLKNSKSSEKIIVLLSDGDNTAGNLSPESAASLAAKMNIKIFSIGIGQDGEVPYGLNDDGSKIWVKSVLNERILKYLSSTTKGQYYQASDQFQLKKGFKYLSQISKKSANIKLSTAAIDYYYYYLYWALILLLIWLGLKSSFMNNFLED
jgi:Ca-activated chloride channel family protein